MSRLGEVVAQMAREDKKDRQDRGSLKSVFQRGETDFWPGGGRRGRTKNGADAVCNGRWKSVLYHWPVMTIGQWFKLPDGPVLSNRPDRPPICSNVAMFICRGSKESIYSLAPSVGRNRPLSARVWAKLDPREDSVIVVKSSRKLDIRGVLVSLC